MASINVPIGASAFTLDAYSKNGNGDRLGAGGTGVWATTDAPTVTATIDSGSSVSLAGFTVTPLALGTTVINLNAATTNSYEAATQKQITINVTKATPTITGTNSLSGTVGAVGAQTATATLTNAYFGANQDYTATLQGTAISSNTVAASANGALSFAFSAADLNTLAQGTYDILVSFVGNTENDAVTSENIGTLTVSAAPSPDKAITTFDLPGQVSSSINGTSITVTMPYGADVTNLVPSITHTGVSIDPLATDAQDFTNGATYTVTAQDTSTETYNVMISYQTTSDKAITAFSLPGQVSSSINGTSITVTMPYGADVTNLVPSITHTGVSISPLATDAQDFTNGAMYTVTAQDGSDTVYTVTVTFKSGGGGGSSDDFEPLTEPLKTYEQAIVIKVKEWANVRSGPSLKNDIIGRVRLGDTIELLQWNKDETWCKIIYTNMLDGLESTGWLWHKFIKPIK